MAACISSCCTKPEEFHYKIAEAAFGFLPYDVNSEFWMRHSTGAVDHFTMVEHKHEEKWVADCGDCCMDEYGEFHLFKFKGDSSQQILTAGLINDGPRETSPSYVKIFAGSRVSYAFAAESDPCPSSTGRLTCLDSMPIQGVVYQHVYRLFPEWVTGSSPRDQDTIWYNPDFGILKIHQFGGGSWELMP
jgi:hypothetical protein